MTSKIIELKSTNPYKNLASEYAYYQALEKDDIIFLLWQNSSCVVMGRNQNIYREVDLSFLKEKNILPVRRFTGGGAVYHDLGNLNFTFISSKENKSMDKWMEIILDALNASGIKAKLDGRNDLIVKGKKISGMAWLEDDKKFMIHGTLMVDLDLEMLVKSLTPDMTKFTGKGIKSVRSRVCNLKEINPDLSIKILKENLVLAFKKAYPNALEKDHQINTLEEKTYQKISKKDWIYSKNEKAGIRRRYYHQNKPFDFEFWIKNDIIYKVSIYSDSLDLAGIDRLKSYLIGKNYSQTQIKNAINEYIK